MASATEEGKDEDCVGRQRRAKEAAGRIFFDDGAASVSGTATGGTASGTTVVSVMLARIAFDDAPVTRSRVITGCSSRNGPLFGTLIFSCRFASWLPRIFFYFSSPLRTRNSIAHHSSHRTAR